jgi:hypothetical protein
MTQLLVLTKDWVPVITPDLVDQPVVPSNFHRFR